VSLRVLWLFLLLTAAGAAPVAAGAGGPSLVLDDHPAAHDAWQVATVLADPSGALDVAQVLARSGDFQPPGARPGSLGRRSGAVWLRVPVQVPPDAAGRWMLDIDYASLDRVDVHVMDGARVERAARLGDHVPLRLRAIPARAHVLPLDLMPGSQRVLLLRVQTTGSMVVPLWLRTPADYQVTEAREQALQGLIAGMGLCLLIYSLAQWAILRDAMFGLYALTLLGTVAFFAALSGVGPQHVWGGSDWLTRNGPPMGILVGVCGAFFFVLRALEVRSTSPRIATLIVLCGGIAGITAVLFAAGAIGYGTAQGVGMALGPAPLLLVLPTAFRRLRAGDRAAAYVLAGWGVYSVGVITIVALLAGLVPVGFWTLHGFQFASMAEMATWMLVLGERVQDIRRQAALMRSERDSLRSLAHTDPLTGLLNRRGLGEAAPRLLAHVPAARCVAVYLIDLDGFKQVNDRLGHEAGDLLLVGVATRLRGQVRDGDLLCRLGGDEFVVVVDGLADAAAAEAVGHKLLRACATPFDVKGQSCRVGMTVGYALSPQDDTALAALMKRADAAMYAGKQAGRNCVRRGAASAGSAVL